MAEQGKGSISVGGNVSGSALVVGDHDVVTLTTVAPPPAEAVDLAAVLDGLRALMLAQPSDQADRIRVELDDAARESAQAQPDRAEVAGALSRAVKAFKQTVDVGANLDKLTDLVTKAAGWIGAAHAGGLLAHLGLTL